MKRLLWLLMFTAAVTFRAAAGEAIPPELVGDWRCQEPPAMLELRADGLCYIGYDLGMAGVATYDAKNHLLTLSLRDVEHTGKEIAKVTVLYDPKALTLTPREKGYRLATYKRHSTELWDSTFKSVDLDKVLHPSK